MPGGIPQGVGAVANTQPTTPTTPDATTPAGGGFWGQLGTAAAGTALQVGGNVGQQALMNEVNGQGQPQAQGQSEEGIFANILLQLVMGLVGGGQPQVASAQSRSASDLDNIESGRRSRSSSDSNGA
jgi:hypothetical protein